MNMHDWVSIEIDNTYVLFDVDQNLVHPEGIFSPLSPSVQHWLLDQDLHSEWKYVLKPTLNTEGENSLAWIGPRWFAQDWIGHQNLSEKVSIVQVQRPCPSCKMIISPDDYDSVYPCNRERTLYQAGCMEHNWGCGYHVYGSTYDAVIEKWNNRSMSESDQLPLTLQDCAFDLDIEHAKMVLLAQQLSSSTDRWVRLLNLQLIWKNNHWFWSGICMRPSQLQYYGYLWLSRILKI